jgi:hypothetical protein
MNDLFGWLAAKKWRTAVRAPRTLWSRIEGRSIINSVDEWFVQEFAGNLAEAGEVELQENSHNSPRRLEALMKAQEIVV